MRIARVDHSGDMNHRLRTLAQIAQRVFGIEITGDPIDPGARALRLAGQCGDRNFRFRRAIEQRLPDETGGTRHRQRHSSTI